MDDDQEYCDRVFSVIHKEFKKYMSKPGNVESASTSLVEGLIDDAILSVVFEVDLARKMPVTDPAPEESCQAEYSIADTKHDIFGNNEKNFVFCLCPNCNRNIASSRFAPHLMKCMGMGRNSSRIARTRIATTVNKDFGGTSSCHVTDDEDDADWSVVTEKKGKKKKERNNGKKIKQKVKNGSSDTRDSSSNICYEGMSERDRRALLSQICGVISEHTKKVCTKSTRCPLHTDEQKKNLRDIYISDGIENNMENVQIDVDTCEEEGEITKESLTRSWEAENSNTSSPADSASTSSTSSSKKREKSHKKSKD